MNKRNIYLEKMLAGDRQALAKIITVIESRLDRHRQESQNILEEILPHTGKSLRIGITGTPGVGKSTFIETLGLHLLKQNLKVAVLAVDPSSPVHGGSILGDKTRMEELIQSEKCYIRPSPSSGTLGGVAQKTRETMLLCEAAGYDVIFVETVGVGQSEVEVSTMVDMFLVLLLPNAGDELQGIKKGILELADLILVNKADGDSIKMAERSMQHYKNAVHMLFHATFWTPEVMTCSALKNYNIEEIWKTIQDYKGKSIKDGYFEKKRTVQSKEWMWKLIHEMLELSLKQDVDLQKRISLLENKVINGETTPYFAAHEIVDKFSKE